MIFLASRPKGVFFATCARSMSPVAWEDDETEHSESITYNILGDTRSTFPESWGLGYPFLRIG